MVDPVAWHVIGAAEVESRLETDASSGLSDDEASRRLEAWGPNEIPGSGARPPWSILRDQFASVLVAVLCAAAAVSFALGDRRDAAVILAIVLLNACIGFRQEYRAERAMASLRKLAAPTVRVRRGSRLREIPARLLVPGDVVLLEAGGLVPADCRILAAFGLRTQESALTGESEPATKDSRPLADREIPLGDRRNLGYMGTVVAAGRGEGVVVATGMRTELGAVAGMLREVSRDPTPLQKRLAQLGRTLSVAALALVAVVFALGLSRGEPARLMFLTAVSLAVAAVPEGLPAVVTIALALGAQRMLGRRALIRRLAAVETLGSVTVICADKTGTLTENRMAVAVLETAAGTRIDLRAGGADAASPGMGAASPSRLLLALGALCNDASLEEAADGARGFRASGDPTDIALAVAAARHGLSKDGLDRAYPRVHEVPFDPARKRMTTVHARLPASPPIASDPGAPGGPRPPAAPLLPWPADPPAACVVVTKGAVDGLLDVCSTVRADGRAETLDAARRARIASAHERMAGDGMRVIGVACRFLESPPAGGRPEAYETELAFVGLFGLIDPPRREAGGAVRTCREAGIRPVMITGDHALTALHVARAVGIPGEGAMTGREIAALTDAELESRVESVSVFARVAPEHKLRIVRALQGRGHVVAMTGDGVNDAPALKKADIGVAMGVAGTDVAKEAADVVLQDDNFATIVSAVAEGRAIYDNIRKFVRYILMSNFGEIVVMVLGPFLGMPLPLLPLQILWINLVTDGLPALALGVEPPEPDVMRRPPRPPGGHVFSRGMRRDVFAGGIALGLVSLLAGRIALGAGSAGWQTIVFTTVTLSQMGNVLAIRTGRESLFRAGLLSNRPLVAAVAATVALQLALLYLPPLQAVFRTAPLSAAELSLCLLASAAVFGGMELSKRAGRAGVTCR